MINRQRVLDGARGDPHRLIGKALQPHDSGVKAARQSPLIELEADLVRPVSGRNVTREHVLDVPSRLDLVSKGMLGSADHSFADEQVGIGGYCRVSAKALRNRQGRLTVSASLVINV